MATDLESRHLAGTSSFWPAAVPCLHMSEKITRITCEHLATLQGKKEKEHVVVDVRDVIEFEAGHIKGSVNCPQKELETNLPTLIPDMGKKIVVIVGPTQEKDLEAIRAKLAELGYDKPEFLAEGFDQFCDIAPLEVEPDLTDLTPEESGSVGIGEDAEPLDPHVEEDEPLL
jgi:rhodanese-related sulfurtransferase